MSEDTVSHIPPHCTFHRTAHTKAPHVPGHCTYHGIAIPPHCTHFPPQQASHPSNCTAHTTALHIPPHCTYHGAALPTAPQCTSHYTAHATARPAKANIFLVLKPGHLLFTEPPFLACQKIPVHTKDLAFLILSPCSICV